MLTLAPQELAGGAVLRPAERTDVPQILQRVHDLALYENETDAVVNTQELMEQQLFGRDPAAYAHVVDLHGTLAGIAVFFRTYSTWTGRPGIWLEDLFVTPEHRGSGYGKALLTSLAELCQINGYSRLEWTVLDWNEPSIAFYRSLGAVPLDEWTSQRLDEQAIARLVAGR
ncbi:GNAT family N-acetyltransferase [Sediminivirga luteola]|uniref:GNAT family N-acetyltransferase n=1 Tax=Sediminivirga luteola TaxID=1774748 RepID=UPI001F593AF2|nr:GNAT family N-acetyltransferase [Sediminivirga luteola]MCI2266005.1 GNAT family N-acetyltransferase [Sediminivirga luteola]